MPKHRLYFSKTGTARYISHLDLMRTFQRAFLRANIEIRHTEGFNPHAFVSIPLPLSVGFSSQCEALEFELVGGADMAEVPERMNAVLPAGVRVDACREGVQDVKHLTYVNYIVTLEYEEAVPPEAEKAITALFQRESLVVIKKSKKAKTGQVEVDLPPLIARCQCETLPDAVTLDTVIRAQNPGLNPELMVAAIRRELPDCAPDFVTFHRKAVLDQQLKIWE